MFRHLPRVVVEALHRFHRIADQGALWPDFRPEETPLSFMAQVVHI